MSYKSFLTRQFEHTYENTYFRQLSTQFKNHFKDCDGLHVFIGNVSCNGHQIDAVFISSGKIIVIDFKNYGGTLTFSEVNPWQISNGADFVFVKGGGGIRNPYQQVNAYRYSLIDFLTNRISSILEPNHENFNIYHLSTLVLFHQPINFDFNEIAPRVQLYFKIADSKNCISTIIDQTSAQLQLTDNEIINILKALDIREGNLFDEAIEIEYDKVQEITQNDVKKLDSVKRLLSNITITSDIEKIIHYYLTLISLERKKEPTVQNEHDYLIDWSSVKDSLTINLENSPDFHAIFQHNRQQQFPKNVFIGVNVNLNKQTLPILYTVISHSDIFDHTRIKINVADFTLFTKPLEERNYPEDQIDELTIAINQQALVSEKIMGLRTNLGIVELTNKITLALSEESPFTSQLVSELKKINKDKLISEDTLLWKFLKKEPIVTPPAKTSIFDFIQITDLNKNQTEAVYKAFNQPLTVVTGPPGTGKTQVVLNILANAIIHDQKVLLASKNNQAVDNVKERLNNLIREPEFFLRFGSKKEIGEKVIPIINSIINKIQNSTLTDNSEKFIEVTKIFENSKRVINENISKLQRIEKLEKDLPILYSNINETELKFNSWLNSQPPNFDKLLSGYSVNILKNFISTFNIQKNELENKYTGIRKILIDLIWIKRYSRMIEKELESMDNVLKPFVFNSGKVYNSSELNNGQKILKFYNNILSVLNDGLDFCLKKAEFEIYLESLNNKVRQVRSEQELLLNNKPEYLKFIKESLKHKEDIGLSLLNETIHNKLRKSSARNLLDYIYYIPTNIPWTYEGIADFTTSSQGFLDIFNITSITSLSIKSAFPLAEDLFDIVIIDEASQCDIASAIPLILRSKKLVVIGDPLQLKHITKVQPYEENYIKQILGIESKLRLDYVNESLYDYCYNLSINSKIHSVFLNEHFRCHPDIISYSNKVFYGPKFGQELVIKTKPEQFSIMPMGIYWINIQGEHHKFRNINQMEVEKVIELGCELYDKNPNALIGITTPFTDQALEINEGIPTSYKDRIKANTVHKFQGDEKDIMILSLVVTHNSLNHKAEWINRIVPFLINVAVTRAKNTLYVVGNAEYCSSLPYNSPLCQLVKYVNSISSINNII